MAGKRKLVLKPTHRLWPAFHEALGKSLQIGAASELRDMCGHGKTMSRTLRALESVGLAQRNVLASRKYYQERGLCCDCEVWYNPELLVGEPKEPRPPWLDEDGNFDSNVYYLTEIKPYE